MVANANFAKIPYSGPYPTFGSFYPFYLGEHADRRCRRLHVVGTTAALAVLAGSLLTGRLRALALLPLIGYGFAWVGHFFFERNRPATFKHPFYSLAGDFVLWWEVVSRQRAF